MKIVSEKLDRFGGVLFFSLLAASVGAVWWPERFVTQDGPAHLENSNILRLWRDVPFFHEYLRLNLSAFPNWFGHVVEMGLLTVAPPAIAEKLFISGYVAALPLSAWYVLPPRARENAIIVFPLVFNCLLLYGFLNFCWSVPVALLLVGLCLRTDRMTPVRWVALASIGFVLYFAHIASWMVAAAALAVIAGWRRTRDSFWCLFALALSSGLAAWFVWSQQGIPTFAAPVSLAHRWSALWRAATAVFTYTERDRMLSSGFGVLLFGLATAAILRRRWSIWAAVAGVTGVLYFASPPQAGYGLYVLERWNFWVLLALALWIAGTAASPVERFVVRAGGALFGLLLLGNTVRLELAINDQVREYLSVAHAVEPHTTILPVQFDSRGPGELQSLYGTPMRHAAGYLAVERRAINLDNYEALTPLFPLIFREDAHPGVHIGHMEDEPPQPEFLNYSERTRGSVDYVLVWDPLGTANNPRLTEQLSKGYREARRSPAGAARLYRRVTR